MSPLIIPAISAITSLIGMKSAADGQREANQTNIDIANRNNQFNKEQAELDRRFQAEQTSAQMAFQERMASTTHQREVEDLRKAGINPIMAANLGGNPAPAGASAGGDKATANAAQVQNESAAYASLGSILSNALDVQRGLSGLENDKQSRNESMARTSLAVAQAKKAGADTKAVEQGMAASWLGTKQVEKATSYLQRLYDRMVNDGTESAKKAYQNSLKRTEEFYQRKAQP